jgi:putative ABC transport system permease protein
MVYVEAVDGTDLEQAEREAADILRARHAPDAKGRDDFVISSPQAVLAAELQTRKSFQRLLLGLALLSLLVAGVGILSIMLLSVRERRGEIGLRVAVGARRPDIVLQFFAEALLLAAAGGAIGILFGSGTAFLIAGTTQWAARVSGFALAVAVSSTAMIGAAAGVIPAFKAASLDPVDALQSE